MLGLFLTLLLAVPAQQQPRLSDEQIDQVIAYARTGDGLGGVRCYAAGRPGDRSEFSGGFAVMLTGPAGRIFDAVKAAQAKGLAFTRAQVTPDMAATTLVVMAYPEAPTQDSSGRHYAPRATASRFALADRRESSSRRGRRRHCPERTVALACARCSPMRTSRRFTSATSRSSSSLARPSASARSMQRHGRRSSSRIAGRG